jgi:hypothetical protein
MIFNRDADLIEVRYDFRESKYESVPRLVFSRLVSDFRWGDVLSPEFRWIDWIIAVASTKAT